MIGPIRGITPDTALRLECAFGVSAHYELEVAGSTVKSLIGAA